MKRSDFLKRVSFGAVAVVAAGPMVAPASGKLKHYLAQWKSGIMPREDVVTLWSGDSPFMDLVVKTKIKNGVVFKYFDKRDVWFG